MQLGRLYYQCRCGSWRWCDRAGALGEEACRDCGTSFSQASVVFWGTGAPGSRRTTHNQVQQSNMRTRAAADGKGGGKGKADGIGRGSPGPQTGPKTPGRQDQPQKGKGKGGAAPAASQNLITYNVARAKHDPLYAAQSLLEMARSVYGADSREAKNAEHKLEEETQAADERRTPAQRATRLRQDRITYLDTIATGLRRTEQLHQQQETISEELQTLDAEIEQASNTLADLDEQIAKYELEAGLQQPLRSGKQVEPAEAVQTTIQSTLPKVRKALEEAGAQNIDDKMRTYEIAMGMFQGATMDILRPDAEMAAADVEIGSSDSDNEKDPEPKAKTPRRAEPNTVNYSEPISAEEQEEAEWTKILGPKAKRAQKERRLAENSIQEIARRLNTPSSTVLPKGGGKSKGNGKGTGKGPGKGQSVVVSGPAGGPQPQATRATRWDSRWSDGPPLLPGTDFPPPGGPCPQTPPATEEAVSATPSASAAASTGAQPSARVTVQLSQGEWQTVQTNRGGDGHLS